MGCDSGGTAYVRALPTDSQGNGVQIQSNQAKLKDNVRILPDDGTVQVIEVTDTSVTLGGAVPPLAVGDVIVRSEGGNQFLRRVVQISHSGGQTVIQTEKVVMTDVFESADISQTTFMGPEFLSSLEPSLNGVTFGQPALVAAKAEEFAAWSLPIHFDQALVGESSRGTVALNGDISLRLALTQDLQIGPSRWLVPTVNHFALIPKITIDGNLALTGQGSGEFRKEIELTHFDYPLVGAFRPVSLNFSGKLLLNVDGYVQADGTLAVHGGVTMDAGIEATQGQWQTVSSLVPTFSVDAPQFTATARVNASLIKPQLSLNLLDMGEVFVNADMLRLEVEADAAGGAYNVKVFRNFSVDAGAHLALGIAPLIVRYDNYTPVVVGNRVKIADIGVPVPPPNTNIAFITVNPWGSSNPLKVGEQRIYFNLCFEQVGLLLLPRLLPCDWSSSNPAILTVRNYSVIALVQGVQAGQADIVARNGGVQGSLHQTVAGGTLSAINIVGGENAFLGKTLSARQFNQVGELESVRYRAMGTYSDGSQIDLTYAVNWSSSDTDKARVFRDGQVDGRLVGTTNLSATLGARSGSTPVIVAQPKVRYMHITPLDPVAANVTLGNSLALRSIARFDDNSVRDVTNFMNWRSLNSNLATVAYGVVTPIKAGEVVIAAEDPNGLVVATKKVVINHAALQSVVIEPGAPTRVRPNSTVQFHAFAQYADGSREDVTQLVNWYTNNEYLGRVSSTGLLTLNGAEGRERVQAFYNNQTGSSQYFDVAAPSGLPSGTRQGYLFVGNFGHGTDGPTVTDNVHILKFDYTTGTLTDGEAVPLEDGAHATHILISHDQQFVFVVGNQSNKVYIYNFDSGTGKLTLANTYATGSAPYQLWQSPSVATRFYLTQQGVPGGSGSLRELDFDSGSATFTQFGSDMALGTASSGIDGFYINNGFDYLYVANTGSNTISALRVNTTTGVGQNINTGTTGTFPTEVVLDENGSSRKLFVSNRGATNNMSQFLLSTALDVNPSTPRFGALQGVDINGVFVSSFESTTLGSSFPTGPNPRGLAKALGSTYGTTFLYTANSGAVANNVNGISAFVAGSIDALDPPPTQGVGTNSATGTDYPSDGTGPTESTVVFGYTTQIQATAPQFLFLTNRTSSSVAGDVVNLTDGTLTPLPSISLTPGDQPFSITGATFVVP